MKTQWTRQRAMLAALCSSVAACGVPSEPDSGAPVGPARRIGDPVAADVASPPEGLRFNPYLTPEWTPDNLGLAVDATPLAFTPASSRLGFFFALISGSDGGAEVTIGGQRAKQGERAQAISGLTGLDVRSVPVQPSAPVEGRMALLGHFELAGSGWVPFDRREPLEGTPTLSAGRASRLLLPALPPRSTAAYLLVTGRAAESEDETRQQLDVYPCPASGEPPLPPAGQRPSIPIQGAARTVALTVPLNQGGICLTASGSAQASIVLQGTFVRFTGDAVFPLEPVRVLDTRDGTGGWMGRLEPQQTVEADLSRLSGFPEGATAVWLRVAATGPVRIARCDGEPGSLDLHLDGSGAEVSLPVSVFPERRWCLAALSTATDVAVTLDGILAPDARGEVHCGPRVPEPLKNCQAGPEDVLGLLNCIPGVAAVPSSFPGAPPLTRTYFVTVNQPADHGDPSSGRFSQRMYLSHVSFDAPLVMLTTGYDLNIGGAELARDLGTNQLVVEHRFFGQSMPSPADWSHLSVEQSAKDSHRIVETLGRLYRGAWLNTGHSKGGMTALFHRRYFPCDVAGTVSYVSPLNFSQADPRFGQYMETIGGESLRECRELFRAVARETLERQQEYLPLLTGTYQGAGSREHALRHAVEFYDWGYWQYEDMTRQCPALTSSLAVPSTREAFRRTLASRASTYNDVGLARAQQSSSNAYFVQVISELGEKSAFVAHLSEFGPPSDPASLLVASVSPLRRRPFDAEVMRDIDRWVRTRASRLGLLYGTNDPWSGAAVELGSQPNDSFRFFAAGNHGVRLSSLPAGLRGQALQMIRRWLGFDTGAPQALLKSEAGQMVLYPDVMPRQLGGFDVP